MKKSEEYALKMLNCLNKLFDEDSENHIENLIDDDNATEFIHALANLMPTLIYKRLTGENITTIDFNHIANRLIFQNAVKDAKK